MEQDKSILLQKELKQLQKEIISMSRDNNRLLLENKSKNETINSLLDKNFTELDNLKSKHEEIIANITSSYDNNIKTLNTKSALFNRSMERRMKEMMDTHYKFSSQKNTLLSNHETNLLTQIDELEKNLMVKQSEIDNFKEKMYDLERIREQLTEKEFAFEKRKDIIESQMKEIKELYETSSKNLSQYEYSSKELMRKNQEMENQLNSVKTSEYNLRNEKDDLENRIEEIKSGYGDIHNKYILLLSDSANKQNMLEEKGMEIISLNSRINEMRKRSVIIEEEKSDLITKYDRLLSELSSLRIVLTEKTTELEEIKIEKELLKQEKERNSIYIEELKTKYREIESNLLEKIKYYQDEADLNVSFHKKRCDEQMNSIKRSCDDEIAATNTKYVSILSERDKQLESLKNYAKSLNENQYVIFNEVEKLKKENEILRESNTVVDQRISEVDNKWRTEMEEMTRSYEKRIKELTDSYQDSVKKSQETNEFIQARLNQTVEALSLAKITINNLKEVNSNIENELQSRESNQDDVSVKFSELKTINKDLKEKLDRSIEMNTNLIAKEKQYENTFRVMQAKYNQLISSQKFAK